MPAATAISLADAQATPVTHTFTPIGPIPGSSAAGAPVFVFEDQSAAAALGNWRVRVQAKRPTFATPGQSSKGRVFRVTITLETPVLETLSNSTASGIAPAPTVAYVPRAFVDLVLPERSTITDRDTLRKMLALLLADTNMVNVIKNLQILS